MLYYIKLNLIKMKSRFESRELILVREEEKQSIKKLTEENISSIQWLQNKVERRLISQQIIFNYICDDKKDSFIKYVAIKSGFCTYTIKAPNTNEELVYISSNLFSTDFTVYNKDKKILMSVKFCLNFLGLYGPLKFYVTIHEQNIESDKKFKMSTFSPTYEFENKDPKYSKIFNCYLLNFKERKIKSSVKNFQLVTKGTSTVSNIDSIFDSNDSDKDSLDIILQLAMENENYFFCDFKAPFNHLLSFALSVIVLTNKTFCEQRE